MSDEGTALVTEGATNPVQEAAVPHSHCLELRSLSSGQCSEAFLLLLLFALPLTTVFLPILLVPTIGLFWWKQSSPIAKQAGFQTLIWTYILTGIIGTTLVILVQCLLSYGFTMIIFGPEFEAFFEQFGKNERTWLKWTT
ncbi:hypothetical protein AB5N19_02678 [Seiridium cardinale]